MAITQTDIWNVFGSDISKLTDSDRLLVKAADGSNAVLILVSQARAYLTAQIQPSISSDGNWYIGGTNVNVKAKGETPHLGADDSGIYYYLDSETVSGTITKHVILPRNDFYVNLSTLTDEQYNALVTNVVNTFNTKLETEIVSAVNAANNAAASANTQSERAKGYADKGVLNADTSVAYGENNRVHNANYTAVYRSLVDNNTSKDLTDTTKWAVEIDTSKEAASEAKAITDAASAAVANANTAASNANAATKSATDAAASATAASIPSDYTSGISEGIAHDEGDADSNRDNYNSDEIGDAHATTLTIDEPYKVCGQSSILTGASAPTSIIPDFTGQIYIDIANGNAYIAVYNSTPTNWVKIN